MGDWVEDHRDDDGFLNLFNEKQTSIAARQQIIWDALRGRKAASARLKTRKAVRDEQKLGRMLESNRTLQSRHEKRLENYYALKNKHRVCTVEDLMSMMAAFDAESGKEHSYAVRCDMVREQIQIRKKLDHVTKIGDTKLTNHSQKGVESPLEKLIEDFALIVQHEVTNGIPIPKPPALLQPRFDKPGDSALLKELNAAQRKEAARLTHQFYQEFNHNDTPGEFVAYKMSRTHVPNPKGYEGLEVGRIFADDKLYKGAISEYNDRDQFWHVKYTDGDEEDWAVKEMKLFVPSFKCGRVINGVYEHSAGAFRDRTRRRRKTGRREDPLEDALGELDQVASAARAGSEFELPDTHDECAGTVWLLVKVYVQENKSRWGVYVAKDEVTNEMLEDAEHLSLEEMEASYDVETAPLAQIQNWIQKSATVAADVDKHPNRRRSPRTNGR